jgi:hypothetical protein
MKTSIKYILKNVFILTVLLSVISCSTESTTSFSEDDIKVSLRDVGHHLLLINKDSTSVVKPVVAIDKFKYQLAFENSLAIHPDSLVNQIKASFQKLGLSQYYLVEVVQCEAQEVAYSYQMDENIEKGIVPCRGRQLKEACYFVTVRFTKTTDANQSDLKLLYLLGLAVLLLLAFIIYKRRSKVPLNEHDGNFSVIGLFKFYPEQNKLVRQATEINLSKKECELLALFVARPNQIIKRDELSKKVWEDQGVIVGRSLDTYISKLRKILKDDDSIKLSNIHGVGYKLEVKK